MNRAFFILLFLLLSGRMCAQQVAGTLTLKEAERRFLERNLSLIAERYNIDMAQAQVLQAKCLIIRSFRWNRMSITD